VEGGDDDEAGIYLEEFAERFAALAATETVGAERGEATGRPFGNHGGKNLQVVRGGNQDALLAFETLRDVGDARSFVGMETIPALNFDASV